MKNKKPSGALRVRLPLGFCTKNENRKLSEKYIEIRAIWCYNIVGDKTCK